MHDERFFNLKTTANDRVDSYLPAWFWLVLGFAVGLILGVFAGHYA